MEGCSWREEMATHGVGAGIRALVPRVPGKQGDRGTERTCLLLDPDPDLSPDPDPPDQCSLNNGGCSHNCSVAPGEGIVCSCPLGMELGPDNHTCQIQSYCAKHLKCSQKCDQNKFSVKCSCYEGWVLEPDGESCRSLGERRSGPRRGSGRGRGVRAEAGIRAGGGDPGGGGGSGQRRGIRAGGRGSGAGAGRRLNCRGRLRFPSRPSAGAHGDPVCAWTGWLGGKK